MTDYTAYIHIPGLAGLDGPYSLAGGTLQTLTFDRWHGIDSSHDYADGKFDRNAPVFWVGSIEAPGDAWPLNAMFARSALLHRTFLLHPKAPVMASPSLSCSYLEVEIENVGTAWQRIIGPAEREWIVFGGVPTWQFNDAELAELEPIAALLTSASEALRAPTLLAALDTLERTARPDLRFASVDGMADAGGFVEIVAAGEALLRDGDADDEGSYSEGMAAAFGRRAAAIFASDDELVAVFTRIYDLRTQLIHGRLADRDLSDGDRVTLGLGRRLLRNLSVAKLAA